MSVFAGSASSIPRWYSSGREVALLAHAQEDEVAPLLGGDGVRDGVVHARRRHDAREQRGLRRRELAGAAPAAAAAAVVLDAEVRARGRLDPVRPVAEVDRVQVLGEDLLLRPLAREVEGQRGLARLLEDRALVLRGEGGLHELLGDRRAALDRLALDDVLEERTPDALQIHAGVLVEAPVLDGHDRVLHREADLVGLQDDAAVVRRQLAEELAAAVVEHGVPRTLELRPVLDVGQIGRDGHHHPERGRQERDEREAGDDEQQPELLEAWPWAHGTRSSIVGHGRPRPGRRVPRAQRRRLPPVRRAGAQARAGPSAAREARSGPHGAGRAPRSHGGPAEAPRVPGPGPCRGPHRRRLHRARGRSERTLVAAPAALGRGDRRERAHVRGAGLQGPRPREDRDALQLRVARHVHGGALPSRAHDHRRADPRARRLRQALRRARARVRARAALSAHAGLRLGRGALRRRARGHRPEVQPPAGPRRPARVRPARAGGAHDADPHGRRRRAEDVEVPRQPDRGHRGARGDVREDDAHPGHRHGGLVPAAPRGGAAGRTPPRATPSTRSRAGSSSASTARRPPPRPRRTSRASSSRATSPRRSTRSSSPRVLSTCLPSSPSTSAGRARRRGACCPRARCAWTASPWTAGSSTSPGSAWTGASCRSAGGSSAGSASRRRRSVNIEACGACAIFVAARPGGPAPAPQGARMVLVWSVRTAEPRGSARRREGEPLARAARRSLKTQQHAYLGSLEIRCTSRFYPSGIRGANSQYSS